MSSPLKTAIKNNDEELVLRLIEEGADVNEIFDNRYTPLMTACFFGFINIVNILIEKNADVNKDSFNGSPAIYVASFMGFLDIVIKLLDSGAIVKEDDLITYNSLVYTSNCYNIDKYNERSEINDEDKKNILDTRIRIIKQFMLRDLICCRVCDKTYSQLDNELFACSKCVNKIYCSVDCQRQDWSEHKHWCDRLIKN